MSATLIRDALAESQFDCLTLAEWRALEKNVTRTPVRIDSRSLEERCEARWLNSDWSGIRPTVVRDAR